jgi:hypothetical protein
MSNFEIVSSFRTQSPLGSMPASPHTVCVNSRLPMPWKSTKLARASPFFETRRRRPSCRGHAQDRRGTDNAQFVPRPGTHVHGKAISHEISRDVTGLHRKQIDLPLAQGRIENRALTGRDHFNRYPLSLSNILEMAAHRPVIVTPPMTAQRTGGRSDALGSVFATP